MNIKKCFDKAIKASMACILAAGLAPLPAFAEGLQAGGTASGAAHVSAQVVKAQAKKAKKKTAISKAKVAKIKAQKYTGDVVKPEPKVTYKGKTLKKGRDYTLKYKKVSAKVTYVDEFTKKRVTETAALWGTAKVVIKGKGKFKGTKTVKFKIKKPVLDSSQYFIGFNNGRVCMLSGDPETIYVGMPAQICLGNKGVCVSRKKTSSGTYQEDWTMRAYRTNDKRNDKVTLPKGLAVAIESAQLGYPAKTLSKAGAITVWTRLLGAAVNSPTSCKEVFADNWKIDIPLWLSQRLYEIDQWCLSQEHPFIGNYGFGGGGVENTHVLVA